MNLSVHPLLSTDSYGKIFLYCTHHDCACVPRHRILLTENVKPDLLQKATETALLRFPYMMLGIDKTDTQFTYRLLSKPPVVLPFDGCTQRYTIGSDDTNGYLFLVGYNGKEIYMEYQHSISDGRGFEAFIRSVLLQYFKLMGYPVENDGSILDLDTIFQPTESEDGYRHLAESYSSEGIYKKPPALHADHLSDLGDAPEVVCEVTFPFSQIRTAAKRYGASPLTVISPLFSRAFAHKFADGSNNPVISQIPVDLRPYLPSITNRYCICFVDIPYEMEYNSLPYADVFLKTSEFLKEQLEPEKLMFRAKKASDSCRDLHDDQSITLEEKQKKGQQIIHDFVHADSFIITNVGEFKLPPSMQPYVLEYGAVLPSASQPFGMLISSYKGLMKISIAQRDHDLHVVQYFVHMLHEIGVQAELHHYPFVVTRFNGFDACQNYKLT